MFQSIHVCVGYRVVKMNSARSLGLHKNTGEISALLNSLSTYQLDFHKQYNYYALDLCY